MTEKITQCEICSKYTAHPEKRRSELMSHVWTACGECAKERREPRWAIVLSANSSTGFDGVKKLIAQRRYVGEEISLREIIC